MQISPALAVSVALLALAVTSGCSGDESDPSNAELRIAIHEDPGSLDPALAGEPAAGNVLVNLMDPLVRLNEDLEPEGALAEGWEESDGRTTVTFRLRDDGRWTNGDRVTALDFEYAWKRVLDPTLAAGNASQFYGIVGATAYNSCERDCEKLRERVGVRALDEHTLEVTLTSPQPWFIDQVAQVPFLPVHRATVERFGRRWTEPANIVTSGPYRLTGYTHDESITLTKWKQWRGADAVKVERFAERIIKDATTALTAFEAGEIDACVVQACIPPDDIERLECGLILHPLGGTEVVLDGAVRRREKLMRDNPGPRAVLKIVELPHEVARRAASEAGDRSHATQFGPMADCAWRALSVAAGGSELRISKCSRSSGTSMMRPAIGSISPPVNAARNHPATRVFGTVAVSTTVITARGFNPEK